MGAIKLDRFSHKPLRTSTSSSPSSSTDSLLEEADDPLDTPPPRRARKRVFALLMIPLLLLATIPVYRIFDPSPFSSSSATTERIQEVTREAGVPQRVVEWSKEDLELRKYVWEAPEPHESLLKIVAGLTDAENRTRSWLLESRPSSLAGTGVGLGATDPPEPIRRGPASSGPREFPKDNEGPGRFEGGDQEKYYELVEEWKSGRKVDVCEKGAWEDEYTALHAKMMDGSEKPRLLEYLCPADRQCGGLADRLLGATSAFLYSILSGRAFSISWEQPVPFDLLFDSPRIDWSQRYTNSTTPERPIYADQHALDTRLDLNAMNWETQHIDSFFDEELLRNLSSTDSSWLRLSFNRGVVLRSFTYPAISPRLQSLGLKASTAYSCLLNYLLSPKPSTLNFITSYTSLFSLPSIYSIGLQIRTGDFSMRNTSIDALNTIERYQQFFTCVDQAAQTYAHPGQKVVVFLISDSEVLKEEALRRFDGRVVVSGLGVSHLEIEKGASGWKGVKGAADGMMNAIAEWYTLAGTDFQILTARSGFGKLATWLRGRPGSTIQIFNPFLEPAYTKSLGKHLPPPPDCSLDTALRSFSDMAQGWSLG